VTPLVVALTGTDHHPFDRMVEWVDAAADRRRDVRFVIQYGMSRPPRLAAGVRFVVHDRLVALLSEASAVVCHGGPGLITEAQDAGHVPLCMPRDPQLGEHVDGHQQRFAALAGGEGVIRPISCLEALYDELDSTLAHASDPRTGKTNGARAAARVMVAAELDELFDVRPFRVAWLHRSPRGLTSASLGESAGSYQPQDS
jgi:UDP-N-acetylglucosamine transferase subunit ALG13